MDLSALNFQSKRERDSRLRHTTNAGQPVSIDITGMRFNSIQDSGDRSAESSSSQYYSAAVSPPPMPAELQLQQPDSALMHGSIGEQHTYTGELGGSPSPSARSAAGVPRPAKLRRDPRGEAGMARRIDPEAAAAAATAAADVTSQVQHSEPTLASLITSDTGRPLYMDAGMRSYSGGQRLKSASVTGFYSEPTSTAVSPVIYAPPPIGSGYRHGDPRSASVDVTAQLQHHPHQRSSRGLGGENEQLLMSPQRMGLASQRQSMYSDEFPDSNNHIHHAGSRQPNNPSPNATSISAQSMTGASTAFSFQNSQRSQSQLQSQSLTLATNRSSTSNSNHNTAVGGSRDSMFLRLKEKMKAFKPKSRPQSDHLSDNKAVFFAGNGSSLGSPTTAIGAKPYAGASSSK
ncbi:hypothetical protein FBU59_000789 [Linderina macrospora]|uniref:Uncharacterized protein n=1 Tax=Linderina macrospora TaxID=4868 RepID=A0ACC1JG64_9FUNG|nr:hypothetical protein FBU59_000789 [Linderina macrospora]